MGAKWFLVGLSQLWSWIHFIKSGCFVSCAGDNDVVALFDGCSVCIEGGGTASIAELNDFLGNSSEVENHLVLAAPTAERQLNEIVTRFSALPLAKLIFTKLDETDQCGALINLPTRANLPLAYLTNGQKVPEDLLLAEAKTVATLVMNHDTESRRMAV